MDITNTDNQFEIYTTDDGQTQIEIRLEQETLWLSQAQMATLFDKDSDTIGLHLKNIYKEGELDQTATTEESSVVRQEGSRQVRRKIRFYNLDAIISVGYRVNSKKARSFGYGRLSVCVSTYYKAMLSMNNALTKTPSSYSKP